MQGNLVDTTMMRTGAWAWWVRLDSLSVPRSAHPALPDGVRGCLWVTLDRFRSISSALIFVCLLMTCSARLCCFKSHIAYAYLEQLYSLVHTLTSPCIASHLDIPANICPVVIMLLSISSKRGSMIQVPVCWSNSSPSGGKLKLRF